MFLEIFLLYLAGTIFRFRILNFTIFLISEKKKLQFGGKSHLKIFWITSNTDYFRDYHKILF